MKNRKFRLIRSSIQTDLAIVKKTIGLFLFVSTQIILTQNIFATEVRENFVGARMLAMGGAGIAVVNDETSLLINPAGLGKLRDFYGTLIDPEMDGGVNLSNFYGHSPFTDPFDISQIKDTTKATVNTYYHARAQVFPSLVVRNFGIGFFGRQVLDAKMNVAGTSMDTFYQSDMAMHLGFNLRMWGGRIKLGVVGKAISRIEINKELLTTGSFDVSQQASEGLGVGSDIGLTLAAPIAWIPTLSAVVRDVGGTPFTAGSNLRLQTTTRPTALQQDVDVAVAFFPIHGSQSRSALTFEYQKIKEAEAAIDRMRYYHVGYEFNYADILFIRAGMNQRYATGGFEIASEHVQWQFTSYGEDIGTDGVPEEDRRYILKFAFRF